MVGTKISKKGVCRATKDSSDLKTVGKFTHKPLDQIQTVEWSSPMLQGVYFPYPHSSCTDQIHQESTKWCLHTNTQIKLEYMLDAEPDLDVMIVTEKFPAEGVKGIH